MGGGAYPAFNTAFEGATEGSQWEEKAVEPGMESCRDSDGRAEEKCRKICLSVCLFSVADDASHCDLSTNLRFSRQLASLQFLLFMEWSWFLGTVF